VRLAFLLFLILIGDLTMLVGAVRCDSYFHALRRAAGFVLGCLGGRSAKILQRARGPSGPARLRTAAAVGALPPRGRDGGRFAGRSHYLTAVPPVQNTWSFYEAARESRHHLLRQVGYHSYQGQSRPIPGVQGHTYEYNNGLRVITKDQRRANRFIGLSRASGAIQLR
jgi:hypothetical protein